MFARRLNSRSANVYQEMSTCIYVYIYFLSLTGKLDAFTMEIY